MLNIVLCIPTLNTAGAEKFVVDLATNYMKKDCKVFVAITRVNRIGEYGKILVDSGVTVVDLSGNNFKEMFNRQLDFFKEVKPDVVHANIGSLFHIMLTTKILKIKCRIYTVHNEAKLLYGDSKIRKLMYRAGFSLFGFIPVAICNTVKKTMVEEFGNKYKKIPLVNNGVDIHKFTPSSIEKNNGIVSFINTGTMYSIKNQKEIVQVFSDICKKYNNIQLTILGDGECRKEIEDIVRLNHIEDRVFMPGICQNVDEYLKKADVYISSSITEGLPLSMLEAMAVGLPIITSDAGGSVDLVETGINGIVYKKLNSNELKEAMEFMINNETARCKYGAKSRKLAEEWSLEKCSDNYYELYKQVLLRGINNENI